ncbi:VanZ family protein [Brevibacterium yomogidense]|uniref:VanZ family protein n=1 Tax=Brevibacterium yomogidense TaxID=946573 RepID=UPI0018DFB9B6|nr:VanZ family protein [Brevibacterium yomogidense]
MSETAVAEGRAPAAVRRRWIVLTVLALVVQMVALYSPSSGESLFPTPPHTDKVFHAASFAVVTTCALLARLPRWIVVSVMLAHAALSELIQWRFIESRSGDLADLLADALGIAVGVLVARMVLRRLSRASRAG